MRALCRGGKPNSVWWSVKGPSGQERGQEDLKLRAEFKKNATEQHDEESLSI